MHCQYLTGLGCLGLGKFDKANMYFNDVLSKDRYDMGAFIHKDIFQLLND